MHVLATLLIVLGITACAASTPPGSTGGTSVDELLQHLADHPDVAVTVRTGLADWGTGQIALVIHGNGAVEVHNLRRNDQKIYHDQFDREQVQQLGAYLSESGFTTIQPTNAPRKPGDVPVVLLIERGGEPVYQSNLWHGDRYQSPGLDGILRRSDNLVARITGGKLPFGKR